MLCSVCEWIKQIHSGEVAMRPRQVLRPNGTKLSAASESARAAHHMVKSPLEFDPNLSWRCSLLLPIIDHRKNILLPPLS